MRSTGRSAVPHGPQLSETRTRGMNLVTGRRSDGRLTLTRDPLRMLVFLLVVVTISRIHLYYPVLATFRPALALSGLAVLYAVLNRRAIVHTNTLSLWPMRVIALLFVLACCSVAFGISLGNSALFIIN